MERSLALELIGRLRRRSVQVVAFDPIMQARATAREMFGRAIICCDTLEESFAAADTVVVCNPDAGFSDLAAKVPPDRRIIDPWGCVQDLHPGLIQPGRTLERTSSGLRTGLGQTEAWSETQAHRDAPE
jgi:hypothetical protein